MLGANNNDEFIDSNDTDYVMGQIRERYLLDSTVTIVLLGSCTHSRRYVDWEIKSSLRQGGYTPNGLISIVLQSQNNSAHLPPRFEKNWNKEHSSCYARHWSYPSTGNQLGEWIDDAYNARTIRNNLIENPQEMMKYNSSCQIHNETH